MYAHIAIGMMYQRNQRIERIVAFTLAQRVYRRQTHFRLAIAHKSRQLNRVALGCQLAYLVQFVSEHVVHLPNLTNRSIDTIM